jgi:hypothetical protein
MPQLRSENVGSFQDGHFHIEPACPIADCVVHDNKVDQDELNRRTEQARQQYECLGQPKVVPIYLSA